MTVTEAKRELEPLKDMAKDIKAVQNEIERIMTIATKMTASFDPVNISGTPKNKMEEALMKLEEYRGRLSNKVIEEVEYCMKCREKVDKIDTRTLRAILDYYYFQDKTLEKTAELIEHSYQWTYELYKTALEKYAEISST